MTEVVWREDGTVSGWPRWQFNNLWRPSWSGSEGRLRPNRSFTLFNVWWQGQFIGVTLFNFSLEYNSAP